MILEELRQRAVPKRRRKYRSTPAGNEGMLDDYELTYDVNDVG